MIWWYDYFHYNSESFDDFKLWLLYKVYPNQHPPLSCLYFSCWNQLKKQVLQLEMVQTPQLLQKSETSVETSVTASSLSYFVFRLKCRQKSFTFIFSVSLIYLLLHFYTFKIITELWKSPSLNTKTFRCNNTFHQQSYIFN